MSNIQTVDELKSLINKHVGYAEQEIYDAIDEFNNSRVEFAKFHVKEALKAAHLKHQLPIEDLKFTMEAYPLTNIK